MAAKSETRAQGGGTVTLYPTGDHFILGVPATEIEATQAQADLVLSNEGTPAFTAVAPKNYIEPSEVLTAANLSVRIENA